MKLAMKKYVHTKTEKWNLIYSIKTIMGLEVGGFCIYKKCKGPCKACPISNPFTFMNTIGILI